MLVELKEVLEARVISTADCRLGNIVAAGADPVGGTLNRVIGAGCPDEDDPEEIARLAQALGSDRQRSSGQRRFDGETRPLAFQLIELLQDEATRFEFRRPRWIIRKCPATSSAFTNVKSDGRSRAAAVDLPAPLGPASTMMKG